MTSIREAIRQRFVAVNPLPAGIYHYQAPLEDARNFRLHLRLEKDGSGVLIINAATILHLNRTAAEFAYHLVCRTPEEQVIRNLASRYRMNRLKIQEDYKNFSGRIDTLISTPDLDPVTFLDFDRATPYSGDLSAPFRIDCALTYRLPATSDPNAAPVPRVTRELSTEEWKMIFDKAWKAGVPQIILTGGEPTLREDIVDLIAHSEENGQVTGLLTDGSRLAEAGFLRSLLETGLDHLLLVIHPEDITIWTTLKNILAGDIFTAVHLTITQNNNDEIAGLLGRLAEIGVHAISLSANDPQLAGELQSARSLAASLNLPLVWDLPVPYSAINPIALEIPDDEKAEGAGHAWLYIEPDGDVFLSQGMTQHLGNLLTDSWEAVWEKAKETT